MDKENTLGYDETQDESKDFFVPCAENDRDNLIREDLLRFLFFKNPKNDSAASIVDLENIEGLSNSEVILHFENIFGKIEKLENISNIRSLLLSGIEFLDESLNIVDYMPMPRDFKSNINNISTKKDILRFLLDKDNQIHIKALLKVMIGQCHMEHFKKEFCPDGNKVESFDFDFNNIFKREKGCKHCFSLENGKTHSFYLESKSANGKHKYRILQKIIRKSSANLGTMDDILRGRIIVKKSGDIEPIIKRLKAEKSLHLEIKDDTSNGTRDDSRQDIALIGNYQGIPVEVQIMTDDTYEKSEEGAKHHFVYEFIQHCIIIERLYGYIPHEYVKDNIYDLSRNKDILNSKIGINNKFEIKSLRNLIWERFNAIFLSVYDRDFYYEEIINEDHSKYTPPYISYGRTIELKGLGIMKFEKERWSSVINALNIQLPKEVKFSGEQWYEIFDHLEHLESLSFLDKDLHFILLDILKDIKIPQYYSAKVKRSVLSVTQ